ncbi:putative cyclopentanol dehydrogenase [Caenibius tardaugens NBRC 16725]|uniref:Putative cyclopentanol dehydrogenase n=1 Tax=Caenibius tardaugens NBRC 16725 TaxID=1219035 RepID=U2ZXJ0_9SPHN|nr:SDR family oxidoreductase [Caenibius tardaugens]AZI35606.1 SDR family oxidoreductase [Caenibius tardaugens NBRC 16725]GAD50109.1 putative cyclopentanol dehydrogenase [Caenibius tardaugens NBRC 16725]
MGRVEGKVALVTGGGSGLGAADCEMLAREGATVVVTDVRLEPALAVADRIGNGALAMTLDVADEAQWIAVMEEIAARFGRLDVLVNNAGVVLNADVEETSLEQFRWVSSIMTDGVFLGCKHAIPLMNRNQGGSIINMSSTGALLGYPIFFAYSAAKGAVRAMTKSVAVMCQEKGYKIRCNSVHPGSIETPMVQSAEGRVGNPKHIPDGVLPPGTPGHPKDVAALVLFLASDESRFVTGAELVVDNGVTIRPF